MTYLLLLVAVTFVAWRASKRQRDRVNAGRDSARPTYSVAPPERRQYRASRDVL